MKKNIFISFFSIFIFTLIVSKGYASQQTISTAFLRAHEAFIVWYAQKHNWDKDFGFTLEMIKFNSGKEIIESKKAYKWQIAAVGAVPALLNILSDDLEIIAIANDESASNRIYAHKDSKIFEEKAYNPSFPEIYGSPQTINGLKLFTTKGTSAHYMLTSWLKSLGISEKDVKIEFYNQLALTGMMESKYGDVYSLWSPYTFVAQNLTLKPVALSKDFEIFQPILLVVDAEFAKQQPEQVKLFLTLYLKGIDLLKNSAPEELAEEYIAFYKDWIDLEISFDEAVIDLKDHIVFTRDEQIKMLNIDDDTSRVKSCFIDIIEFYSMIGMLSEKEQHKLYSFQNINNIYLQQD